jgi:hypothetical protein
VAARLPRPPLALALPTRPRIRRVAEGRETLRTAALVAAGWWAVHQLRYLLAYGGGAGDALQRQGHGYLGSVTPLLGLLLVLVVGRLVVRATFASAGRSVRPQRVAVLWPLCSVAIFALYSVQETTEGILSAGHPVGLAAIFGHGGWIAVPLAVGAGMAVAGALRIGERLESRAPAALGVVTTALPRPAATLVVPAPYVAASGALRGRLGACRGPPALCR